MLTDTVHSRCSLAVYIWRAADLGRSWLQLAVMKTAQQVFQSHGMDLRTLANRCQVYFRGVWTRLRVLRLSGLQQSSRQDLQCSLEDLILGFLLAHHHSHLDTWVSTESGPCIPAVLLRMLAKGYPFGSSCWESHFGLILGALMSRRSGLPDFSICCAVQCSIVRHHSKPTVQ